MLVLPRTSGRRGAADRRHHGAPGRCGTPRRAGAGHGGRTRPGAAGTCKARPRHVRREEAHASARILGCARVAFLGYADSGHAPGPAPAAAAPGRSPRRTSRRRRPAGRPAHRGARRPAHRLRPGRRLRAPRPRTGPPRRLPRRRMAGTPVVLEATVDRTLLLRGLRAASWVDRFPPQFDRDSFRTAYGARSEITHGRRSNGTGGPSAPAWPRTSARPGPATPTHPGRAGSAARTGLPPADGDRGVHPARAPGWQPSTALRGHPPGARATAPSRSPGPAARLPEPPLRLPSPPAAAEAACACWVCSPPLARPPPAGPRRAEGGGNGLGRRPAPLGHISGPQVALTSGLAGAALWSYTYVLSAALPGLTLRQALWMNCTAAPSAICCRSAAVRGSRSLTPWRVAGAFAARRGRVRRAHRSAQAAARLVLSAVGALLLAGTPFRASAGRRPRAAPVLPVALAAAWPAVRHRRWTPGPTGACTAGAPRRIVRRARQSATRRRDESRDIAAAPGRGLVCGMSATLGAQGGLFLACLRATGSRTGTVEALAVFAASGC